MLRSFIAVVVLPLACKIAVADEVTIPGRPPIVSTVFHPDGKRIYFATLAGTEAFDLDTGKRIFNVPSGRELVLSPNGDRLALIHLNIGMIHIHGHITVLDAATGRKLHEVPGTSAQFSPDGRWLMSRSSYTWGHPKTDLPPKVQIIDVNTGKTFASEIAAKKGPGFGDLSAGEEYRFTKDGKSLVTGSRNEAGKFAASAAYDLETGKQLEKAPAEQELAIVPNLSTSADGSRHAANWNVFDVASGKALVKLEPFQSTGGGWRPHFQISADGKTVFSVGFSKRESEFNETTGRTTLRMATQLHAWNADTGKWNGVVAEAKQTVVISATATKKKANPSRTEALFAVNPQGSLAVEYGGDAARVWDLAIGKIIRTFRDVGHASQPAVLRFSPDGKWVVSASHEGEVHFWDAKTGKAGMRIEPATHLNDVCFRPKSQELLGVGHGGIHIWDLADGSMKRTLEYKGNLVHAICHDSGKTLMTANSWSDLLLAIDPDSGKELHRIPVRPVAILGHPKDDGVFTLDASGNIALWDMDTRRPRKQWPSDKGGDTRYVARRLAMLPGGDRFLVADSQGYSLVDVKSGVRTDHRLKLPAGEIGDMDLHPDGKRFAIAISREGDIQERDIESGNVVKTYPGFVHGTSRARYSPDGSALVSCGPYAYEIRIHATK